MKEIRLRAELKPDQVAERALTTRQTITRLESGESLPRIHLFMMVLSVIGPTDEEHAEALQLWEIADTKTVIAHADDLPAKYRRFRLDENEATLERTLDVVLIPGILQTADYATAISRGQRLLVKPSNWEQHAATERHERQQLLTRETDPLRLHALIDEAALRHVIGGKDTMVAQLDHLLAMADLPNITMQVLPFDFGAHGAVTGTTILFSFPQDDEPDTAYSESVIGLQTVGRVENVAALSAVWDEAAAAAPPADRSAELIRAARKSIKRT